MKYLVVFYLADTYLKEIFNDEGEAIAFAESHEGRTRIHPVVTCSCGEEVICDRFTNTCDCGADYNFAGSLLADRNQWGEETVESWQDCY